MSGMMAKLNNDGAFHTWKWICVGRRDVGSGGHAQGDWMRSGGIGAWRGCMRGRCGEPRDDGVTLFFEEANNI